MNLWEFLNSGFFIALLGTAGAITAYVLYRRKIRLHKKDGANILLLEIQRAKRQIAVAEKQFRDAGDDETKMLAEDTFLMPNESWSKYKYLFVQNFDRDEWDAVSSFYDKCELFDEAVIHNNRAFPQNAEQVRSSMGQAVASILTEFSKKNPNDKSGSKGEKAALATARKAADLILSNGGALYAYSPRKPVVDARTQLAAARGIGLDVVTTKLKKIARAKN